MSKKKRNLKLVVNNNNDNHNVQSQFFKKEWLFPRASNYKTLHSYIAYLDQQNSPRRLLQINYLEQAFSHYFDDLSSHNLQLVKKKRDFQAVIQLVFFAAFDNFAIGRYEVALRYFHVLLYNFDDLEAELDFELPETLTPYVVSAAHLGLVEEFDRFASVYPMVDQLLIFRLAKLYAHYINEEYLEMDEELKQLDELNPDYIDAVLYNGLIESHVESEMDIDFSIYPSFDDSFSFYDDEDIADYGPAPFPTPAYEEFVNHLIILMQFGLKGMVLVDYIRTRIDQVIEGRSEEMFNRVTTRSLEKDRQEGLFILDKVGTRERDLLKKAGLVTFEDFLSVTEAEVLAIKGVGPKTIEILKANDVVFKDELDDE